MAVCVEDTLTNCGHYISGSSVISDHTTLSTYSAQSICTIILLLFSCQFLIQYSNIAAPPTLCKTKHVQTQDDSTHFSVSMLLVHLVSPHSLTSSCPNTLTPSHPHTLTHARPHTLTHARPHTLTHSHTHAPSHTHALTPSQPHTLTHSHPHTHTPSHPHTLTPSHTHAFTPSHTHALTPSHTHTLSQDLCVPSLLPY